jgi:hypothetical protein
LDRQYIELFNENNDLGDFRRLSENNNFFKIEAYEKKYHRRHEVSALGVHIVDILRMIF